MGYIIYGIYCVMDIGVAGASWNSVCKDGAWPEDSACWDISKCRVSTKHTHTHTHTHSVYMSI